MYSTAVVRIKMVKKSDREFVRDILVRAAKGRGMELKTSKTGSIVVNDYENSQYYGLVTLGTPEQAFQVIFGMLLKTSVFQYLLIYCFVKKNYA